MITPATCRAGRGLLNWSQEQLSIAAKVGVSTVRNFEAGRSTPIANNLKAIQSAMEAFGVRFTDGEEPGVRLQTTPDEFLTASKDDQRKMLTEELDYLKKHPGARRRTFTARHRSSK